MRARNPKSQNKKGADGHVPTPLRLPALTGLATLASLVVATVVLLRWFSAQSDGLPLISSNQYVQRYAPTAVCVLLTSLWRPVDFYCRALAPWQELHKGNAVPHRSVWLDYTSSLLPVAFWNAVSMGHYAVVTSISCFVLLKVATLASTSLVLATVVNVGPVSYPVAPATGLDNVTALERLAAPPPWPESFPAPVYSAYASLVEGLPDPEGLSGHIVYETRRLQSNATHTNITVRVPSRALVPDVMCWPVEVEALVNWTDYGNPDYPGGQNVPISIITPDWSCDTGDTGYFSLYNAAMQVCPPVQFQPISRSYSCRPITQNNDSPGTRLMLRAIVKIQCEQLFDEPTVNKTVGSISEWYVNIPPITAVLCNVTHHLEEVTLVLDAVQTANPVLSLEMTSKDIGKLESLLPDALVNVSERALAGAYSMFGSPVFLDGLAQPPDTLTKIMAAYAEGDYESLFSDLDLLQRTAQTVTSSLLGQVIHQTMTYGLTNASGAMDVQGEMFYIERRLLVQLTPTIIMVVTIIMFALGALVLCPTRPKSTVADDITRLWSIAKMIRRSQDMAAHLARMAQLDEKCATRTASRYQYRTRRGSSTGDTVIEAEECLLDIRPLQDHQSGERKYAPFTLGVPVLCLTLALPLLIIGLLEYLQYLSDRSDSHLYFGEHASDLLISALTRLLPALVALCVATLYNCLDFNTAVLAPYSMMHARARCPEAMQFCLLGHLPPIAIYKAFQFQHWGSVATGLAAMIASVLTPVTSGLYDVHYEPRTTNMQLAMLTEWNTTYHEASNYDNVTAAVASLIEVVNLTYPMFTYNELALPHLSPHLVNETSQNTSGGVIEARVPVLRAELACKGIESSSINVTDDSYLLAPAVTYENYNETVGQESTRHYTKEIQVNISLPDNCQFGSAYGNESVVSAHFSVIVANETDQVPYVAAYNDVHVGPWDNVEGFASTGRTPAAQPDNPAGCPSVLLFYAYFDTLNDSRSTWTAWSCEQKLQQIDANVTFTAPDMAIPINTPPVLDESTATYLPSGPNGETAFWWRLQDAMDSGLTMFNKTALAPELNARDDDSSYVSDMFRAALYGKTPLPLDTLQRQDRAGKDLVLAHLQMFYKRYMAQYISNKLRIPVEVGTETTSNANQKRQQQQQRPTLLSATYIPNSDDSPDSSRTRLVQHRTSKVVLQGMLGFMFLCAALALGLNTYRGILPWNPCTIMGMMVLFAGSQWVEDGEDGGAVAVGEPGVVGTGRMGEEGGGRLRNEGDGQRNSDRQEQNGQIRGEEGDGDSSGLRFRLGWWRDYVYVADTKARSTNAAVVEGPEGRRWRYGIDIVL